MDIRELAELCAGQNAFEIERLLKKYIPQIAAQILGERGGHATSPAKTAANRAKSNLPPKAGKKRRGRPEGSKNKPKQESVK